MISNEVLAFVVAVIVLGLLVAIVLLVRQRVRAMARLYRSALDWGHAPAR